MLPAPTLNTGERPPRAEFLPLSRPSIGDDEIGEVVACLRSGWLTTGPRTAEFERAFAAYVGAQHALAFSSGTAALHATYASLDLVPGDEIICPSLTWPSTATMALAVGAVPVFADVDPNTLQLDPESVWRLLSPRTRAVVPVHFAGAPADLDALRAIVGDRVVIVEDAAHAVGASYKGRRVGGHGNAAVFSFHPTKDMTTGEGGMLTTDDDELARRARLFRFHGVARDAWSAYGAASALRYDVVLPGFKYNLTDLASAIGLHQLRRLDGFVARRAAIAARYREAFAGDPAIALPQLPLYSHGHAHHLFPVLVDDRDGFAARLREANIGCGLHFEAVHQTSLYRDRGARLPVTERVSARIASLPLFPAMTDADVEDVIAAARRAARGAARGH